MDKKALMRAKIDLLKRAKNDIVKIWPIGCKSEIDPTNPVKDPIYGWGPTDKKDVVRVSMIANIFCQDHISHAAVFHWEYNINGAPLNEAEFVPSKLQKDHIKHGINSTIWYVF